VRVQDELIGVSLGQYQIVDLLGKGGMASVYKAYHPALERYVAVKVLPPYFAHDAVFSERFRREARAIAQLEHPHILPVYDFDEDHGLAYIVMSLVAGGTLKERMGEPLPLDFTVRVCAQVSVPPLTMRTRVV
jgi:eukaryotic-like serine/threonine-protein kinase